MVKGFRLQYLGNLLINYKDIYDILALREASERVSHYTSSKNQRQSTILFFSKPIPKHK